MHKLTIPGLSIPVLYVVENEEEAKMMRENGIPYIIRAKGMTDQVIAYVMLRRTLHRMFPDILWEKFEEKLGIPSDFSTYVHVCTGSSVDTGTTPGPSEVHLKHVDFSTTSAGIAENTRYFGNAGYTVEKPEEVPIEQWLGDKSSEVDIDTLMQLELLPAFCMDVTKAIEKNLVGYDWNDGYNKKLDGCYGSYTTAHQSKNLLIIDISASIPRGISSTMLMLAGTLRDRLAADLIITGGTSMLWKIGDELPDPAWIRGAIPLGNESKVFTKLLAELSGTEYGNVISFGDNDTPSPLYMTTKFWNDGLSPIRVCNVMSFHTGKYSNGTELTGYCKWTEVEKICQRDPRGKTVKNTEWCRIIKR